MQKVLEKDIQKAILEYLCFKRVCHWRNNTGATKTERGGFIRFGSVGSPDIFALKNGTLYGIEVKTATGKLSHDQDMFGKTLELNGAKYIVARSIDDVMKHL